jgi:5-methylcytosine-specific restriction endonuclease McrA
MNLNPKIGMRINNIKKNMMLKKRKKRMRERTKKNAAEGGLNSNKGVCRE